MKRCVVIGGAELDFTLENMIKDTDFVICADRGWQTAEAHGIKPDMIVGDFDSSPLPDKTAADVTVLPVVKDDTDTYHIAKYIVENGYTDVLMAAVLGGKRMEHTIANLQTLLYFASNRINATAMDSRCTVMVIKNGHIQLPDMPNKFFSLFSMGDSAKGVTVRGAKYPLDNYDITNFYPIGISNEFIGETVDITVQEGSLLLIITEMD